MAEDKQGLPANAPAVLDLQQLIEAYGDRLARSAFLLCGDETEAQDLTQEALLQALKSAHRFRGQSAVYTWVYGILRHLCQRHLRKQKRFLFEEKLLLNQVAEPESWTGRDQEFCVARLAQALQRLSPDHREAVVLRYYENLKMEEMADAMGVSIGTVKSRLHYAVRRLRELLPKEMNLFAAESTHDQAAR